MSGLYIPTPAPQCRLSYHPRRRPDFVYFCILGRDNRNNRTSEGGGGRQPIGMVPYNVFAAACGNEVTLNETLETGFPINLLNALIVSSTNYTASFS